MTATRFAARARARRPLVRALATCALSLGIPLAAQAAALTPEQTVDVYLGAIVNNDAAKVEQFNDTVRETADPKEARNMLLPADMYGDMREQMLGQTLALMSESAREALAPSLDSMLVAYTGALRRSQCNVTGVKRTPGAGGKGQERATVSFECKVADVTPPGDAATKARADAKTDQQRFAAVRTTFTDVARAFNDAPVSRRIKGQVEMVGSDSKGWTTDSPESLLKPVVDALSGPVVAAVAASQQ
ncbi:MULTISPECIES: hypothetical protein [Burkholderia]|uniref:hypothetical protein n=1 Tax=Burkholderia TaxID=32008 RepID=UPI0015883770|nr:hypothetical protein [Burkholderia cepacia]MCA8057877.1 hypothetical protein [Burkholderia cepacia]MCA8135563.1 hypothetical protein [Burkholderia cepacia]MCA8162855.1 hypothetical protein [Burkholderia cepacia]MDN7638006.1 hypothetical protein [Burkholderia cepacia]HEM7893101.1 hypothetical protein [Burkholderia cepacia]